MFLTWDTKNKDWKTSLSMLMIYAQPMFVQVKHGVGVEEIVNHIIQAWEVATGKKRH